MRIACVLAEGFEDSEFKKPYDEFKKAGHEVTVIGAEKGKTLAGKAGKEKAKVDSSSGQRKSSISLCPSYQKPKAPRRLVIFV